ncbi:toxin-antitoxin system HicB family antitoxin [Clostridium butyricum]|uniref:toxin-antitoxin system HicB family antitoxin n=1 Tax=Clostridium butyricum TaxID=1492 RepID=UPI002AB1E086|nr:toxin-antitoxin system HicB family antitoxin [Clostridium butyricum]
MNSKRRLTIRIPNELNMILTKKAENIGISKNGLVLQILWDKVKKEGEKQHE